ncbi:hypothetical protein ElyMa_004054200 [Elysia marginata]|uniref:Uncharacterized protein n=1 Tax=Elysia marginata TaxID=1093978 RepID=A0AAV4G545_9GAST|nr:hypothetical protein ElyMa_004054200 [Elysia marginata]
MQALLTSQCGSTLSLVPSAVSDITSNLIRMLKGISSIHGNKVFLTLVFGWYAVKTAGIADFRPRIKYNVITSLGSVGFTADGFLTSPVSPSAILNFLFCGLRLPEWANNAWSPIPRKSFSVTVVLSRPRSSQS